MRNVCIALSVVAALTLGALGTAEAHNKGRRDGAHEQRPASMQHRASPRKFQHAVDRREARQHARIRQGWQRGRLNRKQVARLHRNQKQFHKMERRFRADGHYTWRMKGNRYRANPGYRKHRYFHGGFRRLRRHHRYVYRAYPVYERLPSYSFGLEIETEDLRFRVNESR
ncbi:MAG: hypothetical protein BMS9Abin01_2099 [Gammaproteobacteria bacterium]|nr:MAG: hypothetical protein BMS9Abin01_2099 [Gammaproteobacteria bacterium]